MPQFNSQLFPRPPRRPQPPLFEQGVDYNLDVLGGQVLHLQQSIDKLLAQKSPSGRHGPGQPITREHERAVKALMTEGVSRAAAAKQIGISRTAVSLIAAGKYPFGAHA